MRYFALLLLIWPFAVGAQTRDQPVRSGAAHSAGQAGALLPTRDDTAAVRAVAEAFFDALAAHDTLAVAALLHADARVLEAGRIETRAEYLAHHVHSDAAFLDAMTPSEVQRTAWVLGDVAWVSTQSRLQGVYRDRARDLDSAELLVLRRDASAPQGWSIAAVHWSSRARE